MPFLRLFQCSSVLNKMDYCEVVNGLLTVLILISNKTDTMVLTEPMLKHYQKADELIQQLIIREISSDIGKVAQKLIVRQLAKVNTVMKTN